MRFETNSRLSFLSTFLSITLISVQSSFVGAVAEFRDGTLILPYIFVGDELYNVELVLADNRDPLELSVGSYYRYADSASAPTNSAFFEGNVLSIPLLRFQDVSYKIQLDYIADENVFRLLEPIATLINSTDGVLCAYLDNTINNQPSLKLTSTSQWSCTGDIRILSANGIPDHTVGTFPNANNPHAISEQAVSAEFTLAPRKTSNATEFGGPNVVGYILNGVKVDAGTAGTCNDSGSNCSLAGGTGSWSIEALGQSHFDFGDDSNHAHVQPGGAYHYHGVPEGFVEKRGGSASKMTIIGWAADGFPIYSRYGYSIAGQSNSNIRKMLPSYRLIDSVSDERPPTSVYSLGTFSQDWVYEEGLGDLDECNGRWGVTPEFPQGIYHYYATDEYPYFQRCVRGEVNSNLSTGAGNRAPGRPRPPPRN